MDENNQILDVTYGNFSCRLEGFEDSVETMKTVVAFFHDLAGHERFMDVPPLAPDMDTLARLTEEQSGQSVEIQGEANSVSLRALKDDDDSDLMDEVAALEDELDEVPKTDDAGDAMADEADVDAAVDHFDIEASVADKLQRIREVVDGSPETETEEFAEDLSDDAAEAATPTNPLSQRLADLAQHSAEIAQEDGDAADNLRDVFDETANEEEALDDDVNAFDDDEFDAPDSDDDAEAAEADTSDHTDDVAADDHEDDSLPDAEAEDDLAATDADQDVDAGNDEAAEDETDDAVTADEAEPAEAKSGRQKTEPLVLTADDVAPLSDEDADAASASDDDDDFDLEKEVAKVEAEIAARQEGGVARHGLPRSVEDAMSRIMSQTDQHLNQPESRRHRDAFAQLKAAVAATEAARQLGDAGANKPDPDEAFKDDLGAHDAEEKIKSQAIASAPLQLVPSQKVEPEDDADAEAAQKPEPAKTRFIEPVTDPTPEAEETSDASKPLDANSERLRQIAALKEADTATESAGFAEFAAAHGATELVDQLEAAGAYICFVEGAPDFSRPQVMKVVQSASSEEITREDGLRCFGRLLRQSRLVKLANGRFQVADNTQYRPDGDQAAQG